MFVVEKQLNSLTYVPQKSWGENIIREWAKATWQVKYMLSFWKAATWAVSFNTELQAEEMFTTGG